MADVIGKERFDDPTDRRIETGMVVMEEALSSKGWLERKATHHYLWVDRRGPQDDLLHCHLFVGRSRFGFWKRYGMSFGSQLIIVNLETYEATLTDSAHHWFEGTLMP